MTIKGSIRAENTTPSGNAFVGGITGYNSGAIADCSTTTSLESIVTVAASYNEAFVGGIAGYTLGDIRNSDHSGELRAEAGDESCTNRVYVGGIAGYALADGADMVIENCQNNANIESINKCDDDNSYRAYAGGIVGHIDWVVSDAAIKNCANIGSDKRVYTEAPTTMTGGIAGSSRFIDSTNISIINCYNRSNVVSQMLGGGKRQISLNKGSDLCTGVTAGGIIGAAGGMEILYSYSSADVISATAVGAEDAYPGGIAGIVWDTRFTQNYYETNANVNIGIGGAVVSQTEIDTQADVAGKVEGATAAQLKTKSFFGVGWEWYTSGGVAPDYYSADTPWRFTAQNSYPTLRGLPYTYTPPSEITYNITATANGNGSITPNGKSVVEKYDDITFTIKPDKNYIIEDVLVDGVSVGAVSSYTLSSVKANHTIEAKFAHDCPSKPYTDVDITQWYHEGIDYVLLANLFKGTSGSTFEPNTPMTRGMLATVLHRLEGTPSATAENPFTDVAFGEWYTEAVDWAAENIIVKGYDADTYGPNDPVTREQMAAILHRYAEYKGYDVSVGKDTNILSYEDALKISEYAVPAMQWACGAGIIEGDGAKLDPQGNATRAQVATMLMRFIENVVK